MLRMNEKKDNKAMEYKTALYHLKKMYETSFLKKEISTNTEKYDVYRKANEIMSSLVLIIDDKIEKVSQMRINNIEIFTIGFDLTSFQLNLNRQNNPI